MMATNTDKTKVDPQCEQEEEQGATAAPSSGMGPARPQTVKALLMEPYLQQMKIWPNGGKHILAQYDDSTVIVYQAFKPSIAKYAVEHQHFGGPDFSFTRMSWIKTNFLWMMYRCGWAEKRDQECVLAVRIPRHFFNKILRNAYTIQHQKQMRVETSTIQVRLQWDPDHKPNYDKCQRRAIQLGLKREILAEYSETCVGIMDVTTFVREQHVHVRAQDLQKLEMPRERVFIPDTDVIERIELDSSDLTSDFHM